MTQAGVYLHHAATAVGVAAGYAFVVWPAGWLTGRLLRGFGRELEELTAGGLRNGGLWIGRLERVLVLTFVLMGQYNAIGFLIAAKSILRFGEISGARPGSRKMAEYVLIGTMLSLLFALAVGLVVRGFVGRPF